MADLQGILVVPSFNDTTASIGIIGIPHTVALCPWVSRMMISRYQAFLRCKSCLVCVAGRVLRRDMNGGKEIMGGGFRYPPPRSIQWQQYTVATISTFRGSRFERWIKYGICRPFGQ